MNSPAIIIALASALAVSAADGPTAPAGTELLRDPAFRRGFVLLRPEPGRKVKDGVLRGPGDGEPVWQLAQWSSRHPFDSETPAERRAGGAIRLANPGRTLVFGGDDGVLSLGVNAAAEYADRPRAKGEPWVHLLVEQPIDAAPRIGDLSSCRFHLEARLVKAALVRPDGHDPRIHAAQFQVFLTVQYVEKGKPGHGDYLWFGIPVYDNRRRTSPAYAAPDSGGTGKFIYTAASERFTAGSAHDDGWVTFEADVLPMIRDGLAAARGRGFLRDLGDDTVFRITSLNMGWEVPGTFDVEMQVRRMSLVAGGR